jgi:CRISPR-associated protein Csb2
VPELLSGHRGDGAPSEAGHAAVVPLPFVTGPHPDGALLGVALVLPRGTDDAARQSVMRAVTRLETHATPDDDARVAWLELGGPEHRLVLKRVVWDDAGAIVRPRSWTRGSMRWASATPVALDRNPGDLHAEDPAARARAFEAARASIVDAIERIGLPRPIEVDVVRSCVVSGTAKPRAYPRFPIESHKPQRVLVHVRIVFGQRVGGPVLIGAGRYHGLGLCLPVDAAQKESP